MHGRCLSDGPLRSHFRRPLSRRLVDGRLSDRGLGSRSVVRGWFRFRRLRNWIGLGRRVLAGRSHRRVGWGHRHRFGWRCHGWVRRASLRRDRHRSRGGIGVPSRRNVSRCGLRLSLRLGYLRRCVDGDRRKLGCGKPGRHLRRRRGRRGRRQCRWRKGCLVVSCWRGGPLPER